jgi:hypothetical protein
VDRLIREHAAAIDTDDADSEEKLAEAWYEYAHRRKQVAETPTGQLKRDCTLRMCEDALTMLAAFGLLVVDRTMRPPRKELKVWRSTDRFRAHVAASGGPLVWHTIIGTGLPDRLQSAPGTEVTGADER